jgi:hydrogenase nickel incorporation protein HypA/HybF
MHELGIAQSVLEAVHAEAARHPGARASKVVVRIGELAAVDPSALEFCFGALVRETELESLILEIEVCPRRHRCLDCGTEFPVKDYDFQCQQCRGMRTECIGGDQIELAYLDLEEHEPSTA